MAEVNNLEKKNIAACSKKKLSGKIKTVYDKVFHKEIRDEQKLVQKTAPLIHADLLCLDSEERKNLLEEVGVSA